MHCNILYSNAYVCIVKYCIALFYNIKHCNAMHFSKKVKYSIKPSMLLLARGFSLLQYSVLTVLVLYDILGKGTFSFVKGSFDNVCVEI